jgi:hypothetical protein
MSRTVRRVKAFTSVTTMAKDNEPFQFATGFAEHGVERVMEQYFNLLQNAMSALPWSNTNLNRVLLSQATQNVTATFSFLQKLSQAKNFADVVKIQTEFMSAQLSAFNDQAKTIGEIYAKAAADAMKAPLGRST